MKPTVIISGIAGLIGSAVASRLNSDYEVIGIDDLSGGSRSNIPIASQFREINCLDADRINKLFSFSRPRFVIHCAAMAAENLSHNVRTFTYRNNLVGEATIRNAAINHDVECMVSMSSIAVMGHQEPPFTEATLPRPEDPYAISKFAGELDAKTAKEFFGLNYVVLRPHNVLGRGQNLCDKYRNVAAIFIRAIKENRPLPIFGDGNQTRAFSPVSYVADIIAACISRPNTWNEIYNVGSDEPVTVNALAAMLEKLMKKPLPAVYMEARKEAVHAHMNHDKVKCAFSDIEQTETIEEVLCDMLEEAFSTHIPDYQQGPEIEIAKNLPESWTRQP